MYDVDGNGYIDLQEMTRIGKKTSLRKIELVHTISKYWLRNSQYTGSSIT